MGFEPSFTGFEWVRREFDDKGLGENGFHWVPLGWNGCATGFDRFRWVWKGLEWLG